MQGVCELRVTGGAAGVEMGGALATIGRNAAVAKVKGLKFRGFAAWLVWIETNGQGEQP
jgi:NADH dehydrogenase FAD-containing subunit